MDERYTCRWKFLSPTTSIHKANKLKLRLLWLWVGLHNGPWSRTTEEGLFQRSDSLQTSFESLGTKKNDHPQKVMCWFVFIHAQQGHCDLFCYMPKKGPSESLIILWSSRVKRCGLQSFSQHLVQTMSDLIWTCSCVIYMWLVVYARGGHSMSSWTPCALKVCYPYITFHRWFYNF